MPPATMTASSRTNWITQAIGLTSFTYLSQAFSILLLPVITRNFTPGDFGIYAVFISVLALVSVFASWRYYLAIALPEKDEDSKDIVWGSFALLTFMTIFLFLIIVQGRVLVPELIAHITEPRVRDLVSYLLPLGFFGVGISTLLSGWSMRIGKSIDLGVIRFIQVVATIAIQLTLKLNGTDGAYALVVGMVLGQLLSVVVHLVYIRTYSNGFFHLNAQGAWLQMKNYSYLPRTIVQTELFNAVGKKSLPLILAAFFGAEIAGLWYFCNTILGNPIGVLTGTVWQVSHNKLAKVEPDKRDEIIALIHRFSCVFLAVPIAIVVGYSEYIPAILGANWVGLSLIIPVYGVMLFVNSVSNTSSYFVVYRKYKAEGYFNILLTSLPLIVILYGSRFLNGMESVYLYCFVGILLYFLLNMYWAVVTKNTACFLGNYMLSTGLNLVAVLVILSLNEVSLPLSLGVMSLYLLLYTRYLLWERFNALKNV